MPFELVYQKAGVYIKLQNAELHEQVVNKHH